MAYDFEHANAALESLTDANDPVGSALRMLEMFRRDPEVFEAAKEGKVGNPITVRTGVDGMRMAQRHAEGVANTQQRWVEGVRNPRANPQEAAVQAAGAWTNGVQAAVQRNAYANGVRGYDLDEAIDTATADGGAAWVAGVQKRQRKIERAFNAVAPQITAAMRAARAMPKDSHEQRVQRSVAFQNALHATKVGGGGAAPRR